MSKMLPVSLEAQLKSILREHFENELPRSKQRGKRNGDGYPLTAWMRGAQRGCESRIQAVCAGRAQYPYTTCRASTEVLARRIAERYQVTWPQFTLIEKHVGMRYRGTPGERWRTSSYIGIVCNSGDEVLQKFRSLATMDALDAGCAALKRSIRDIPLRALIDERLTNILLLMQFDAVVRHKRQFKTLE